MESDCTLIDGARVSTTSTVDETTLLLLHGLHMDLPVCCDLCSEKFYDLNVFDNHMLTHLECHLFFCQFCNNTYRSWSNLVAHRKACHHGKVLSCEDCGKRKIHLNLGPVNYPIGDLLHGCEECSEEFNSMQQLIRHYTKRHGQNCVLALDANKLNAANKNVPSGDVVINLVCPICKCIFLNLEQLATHVKKLCPGCPNMINISETELCATPLPTEHINAQNSANVVGICKELVNYKQTNNNKQISAGNGCDNKELSTKQFLFKCPFCMQDCAVPSDFLCHVKFHTSNLGHKNIVCKICNIPIKKKKDLIKHLEIKHWDNLTMEYQNIVENMKSDQLQKKVKFSCEYCGREFDKKETLSLHVQRHLGERPYKCEICNRLFYTSQQLVVHKNRHSGSQIQSYKAVTSNRSLDGSKSPLIKSTNKTYTCLHCNKQFLNRSLYIIHVRLHTGHPSFTCSVCKKMFTLKSKLNVHLKTHHNQPLLEHKCFDCGTCFNTTEQLANHCNEESCVTLVTLSEGNKSEESGKKFQSEDQYIIRFSDHDL